MSSHIKGLYSLGTLVLLFVFLLAYSLFFTSTTYAYPRATASAGTILNWANVRSAPTTNSSIVATYAPGTIVTVYAIVFGQNVWGMSSAWYCISPTKSVPRFVYGDLVLLNQSGDSGPQEKKITISIARQWMYVYQDGKQVYNAPVSTGRPELPTPTGTYHVFAKFSPTTFYSPWPPGSPFYYPPTHINYALEWNSGGYFLHDAWWRTTYGPGTNVWHIDPVYGWMTGTHGCIVMPLYAAVWLYHWAPIGTTVQINP